MCPVGKFVRKPVLDLGEKPRQPPSLRELRLHCLRETNPQEERLTLVALRVAVDGRDESAVVGTESGGLVWMDVGAQACGGGSSSVKWIR